MKKAKQQAFKKPELSKIPCKECGEFIPKKRLQLVKTDTCVDCMQDLERLGRGTQRHHVEFEVEGVEEVEAITLHIIRGE
jgi:RNA polymerase-binding transcription factor DksA